MSTRMWRFLPLIFLPASKPCGSMEAPLVWGSSCQALKSSVPHSSLHRHGLYSLSEVELATGAGHRATALYPVDRVKIQTMMRSCASAAKLRDGAPILFPGTRAIGGHGDAASDSCRRAVGRCAEIVKSVGVENLAIALMRRCAGRRRPVLFPSSQSATKQSATFGQGRRSSSFACPWRSPSGLDTISPGRYRPESAGTAKQVGSCRGGPDRYRPEPVPSRAVWLPLSSGEPVKPA